MQVLIDVSVVIIDEFTPATPSWFTWRDLMHFMDIICCCAILFPIAWRIRHLREASATDGKAERCAFLLPLNLPSPSTDSCTVPFHGHDACRCHSSLDRC